MRYHPQILRGERAWENGRLDKNWPIAQALGEFYGPKRVFAIYTVKFAPGPCVGMVFNNVGGKVTLYHKRKITKQQHTLHQNIKLHEDLFQMVL